MKRIMVCCLWSAAAFGWGGTSVWADDLTAKIFQVLVNPEVNSGKVYFFTHEEVTGTYYLVANVVASSALYGYDITPMTETQVAKWLTLAAAQPFKVQFKNLQSTLSPVMLAHAKTSMRVFMSNS